MTDELSDGPDQKERDNTRDRPLFVDAIVGGIVVLYPGLSFHIGSFGFEHTVVSLLTVIAASVWWCAYVK